MTIPDYQAIMLPLLKLLGDGKVHSKSELVLKLSDHFKLTPSERRQLLSSGKEEIFNNRVGWARTYLKKAGLLKPVSWGTMQITDKGKYLLSKNPLKIDLKILSRYSEFQEFKKLKTIGVIGNNINPILSENQTPSEILERASKQLNDELQEEILNQLKKVSPSRFERIVVDVLVEMGYGGSYEDAARAIGRSGDEGIDGVINEDQLGLNKIFIQAKRWNKTPVNHSEIRNFIGAIDVKHADKGVFITTSSFTEDARKAINHSSKKIVLIDGQELTNYMLKNDVGVSIENTIKVKRLDSDYYID
jgi:restriction system protein